jgi:hypothetical protein
MCLNIIAAQSICNCEIVSQIETEIIKNNLLRLFFLDKSTHKSERNYNENYFK